MTWVQTRSPYPSWRGQGELMIFGENPTVGPVFLGSQVAYGPGGTLAVLGSPEIETRFFGGSASDSTRTRYEVTASPLTDLVMQTREAIAQAYATMEDSGRTGDDVVLSQDAMAIAGLRARAAGQAVDTAKSITERIQKQAALLAQAEAERLQAEADALLAEALLRQRRENSVMAALAASLMFWYS